MAFSGGLVLTDLNDFISPSQACVKPVEVKKTAESNSSGTIKIDNSGGYYEVGVEGEETKLEAASITLNDCLACSGCITSAESILVSMQSQEELFNVLKANKAALESGAPQNVRTVIISISPQSRASIAAKYNLTPLQVAKRLTWFFKNLGVHQVFDTSFSRDFSLVESAREFVGKYKKWQSQNPTPIVEETVNAPKRMRRAPPKASDISADSAMPMLASACPGWICYAEKTHGYLLPHISTTKSPQQIMGSLVKDFHGKRLGLNPDQIYHVCVMPCYDKKLEASRQDFYNDVYKTREVDCVITTGEVEMMFQEQNTTISEFGEADLDAPYTKAVMDPNCNSETLLGSSGSSSGGYLEYIFKYAARELFGLDIGNVNDSPHVTVKTLRTADFYEVCLMDGQKELLKFAGAYGFRNIQNLVRKVKLGRSPYHFVEVMACPSGCINGGGQLKHPSEVNLKEWLTKVDEIYKSVDGLLPEQNETVIKLYSEWLGGLDSEIAQKVLHTQYHAVEANLQNPLAVKW
ncbi:cytosolic Fe-S cluster assembly factor narfl [Basidiobolus meristosporus CBS 931.73]|uniref:Cytosolic Fe-S cluster assembly factor narfl n=1 Tax=Basidiobolus meristosporus CBS 931.73 TaxID=1314790 RepID=A0A1Y1Y4J4_9FUNG|nr:cytosolic Fe-S cluster assembly factor narfl [Basidiobolus meristosporus CBS 931.73]|eukprot:ORX92524.1 cytosolic Fe-S cluster assembly factor narfl [Basidiobolus meristosporus CBS 931.73]